LGSAAAFAAFMTGCRPTPKNAAGASPASTSARITQFYATAPALARGGQELLCYGVENARTVHLSPPPQELWAAVARCVEVNPTETTHYTLTAEGPGGPPATQELTVTVGPPRAKIIDVTVSSLTVAPGNLVSLCYRVENAASVEVEPIHFRAGSKPNGCALAYPRKSTTYVIWAIGAAGDRDREQVTVKVE